MTASSVDQSCFWSRTGITFSVALPEHNNEVLRFLRKHFVPDEPILRSLGILSTPGFFGDRVAKQVFEVMVGASLRGQGSLLARKSDGKLIGVRLGHVFHRDQAPPMPNFRWMSRLPFRYPKVLVNTAWGQRFLDKMQYDPALARKQLPDSSHPFIYQGHCVCVHKDMRGLGLGKELTCRSIELAKQRDCGFMYLLATSCYSQKIFNDLNFITIKEEFYRDFKDDQGRVVVHDHREHQSAKLMYLDVHQ